MPSASGPEERIELTPSLRRHYPDQVYGYDLRLSAIWPDKHPGNTENFKAFVLKV